MTTRDAVPREPTPEMLDAAHRWGSRSGFRFDAHHAAIWRAMYDAAPAAAPTASTMDRAGVPICAAPAAAPAAPVAQVRPSLLREAITGPGQLVCHCPPDKCQAPVIMGRQTPCLRNAPNTSAFAWVRCDKHAWLAQEPCPDCAAAPAAPAPDADGLVRRLRWVQREHIEQSDLIAAADLIEQQARELAEALDEQERTSKWYENAKRDHLRAERDLEISREARRCVERDRDAARAAIAAADAMRAIVPVGKRGTAGPGIELSREARIAHHYDELRAAMGDGNG